MNYNNFYEVEKIIDRRIVKGKKEYLIKWKDYPESQSTWEPISHLKYIQTLVDIFNEQYNNNHNSNSKINNKGKKEKKGKEKSNKEKSTKTINKNESENNCNELKIEQKKSKVEKENKLIGKKRKTSELKEVILDRNEAIFQVDKSLEKILAIKLENKSLIAVVEKREQNGKINKEIFTTEELKKVNPWILIDYYEEKIRFG